MAVLSRKKLLPFIICGPVGGGKSTVIGRLLRDCKLRADDRLAPVAGERASSGATGDDITRGLVVDSHQARREQSNGNIVHNYFATPRRAFIAVETPRLEQHARSVLTGPETADIAVLAIEARGGLLPQIRYQGHILALLGIRDLVLLLNKMDTIGWDRAAYERIRSDYSAFAAQLGVANVTCIPACALQGDNLTRRSSRMSWYEGPILIEHLESAGICDAALEPLRMPIEWVDRASPLSRDYGGTIVSGTVHPGDRLSLLPSGKAVEVARIATFEGDLDKAVAGQAVTLTLAQKVDASRGDVLAAAAARPAVAEQFAAYLIWMGEQPMLPGRSYLLQSGIAVRDAQVTALKHKLSAVTFEHVAATHLERNEIAFCNIALDRAIAFDPYFENRETGSFILIDRMSNATVACGMIAFALRRSANIHWQALKIDKVARAALKAQKPCVLWLTGLSAAGKSTIADLVEQSLHRTGHHTILLDGDNVRHGLNRDLGFTDEDRVENIRRVAEVAKLMVEAGLIVIVSFISPFRSERRMARGLFSEGEFMEIYVDTPLEVCEARDPKGLYKLARAGKLPNLTGIGSPYEPPERAEVVLAGTKPPQLLAEEVMTVLSRRGITQP